MTAVPKTASAAPLLKVNNIEVIYDQSSWCSRA